AGVARARAGGVGFRRAGALDGIMGRAAKGGTGPREGPTVAEGKERFASRLAAELVAKPNYSQFRVIGVADGGREILRVDRSGQDGTIRVVPDAELQPKGDRGYFRRALEGRRNDVYRSPGSLNGE